MPQVPAITSFEGPKIPGSFVGPSSLFAHFRLIYRLFIGSTQIRWQQFCIYRRVCVFVYLYLAVLTNIMCDKSLPAWERDLRYSGHPQFLMTKAKGNLFRHFRSNIDIANLKMFHWFGLSARLRVRQLVGKRFFAAGKMLLKNWWVCVHGGWVMASRAEN